MPLKKATNNSKSSVQKAISQNIRELYKDNQKPGKEKGNNGIPRGRKQIIAIAISQAKKNR